MALELHAILSQSDTNLRQPVGLEEQLLAGRMASDVGQSMLLMLQVKSMLLMLQVICACPCHSVCFDAMRSQEAEGNQFAMRRHCPQGTRWS